MPFPALFLNERSELPTTFSRALFPMVLNNIAIVAAFFFQRSQKLYLVFSSQNISFLFWFVSGKEISRFIRF